MNSDHSTDPTPNIALWLTDNIARLAQLPASQMDEQTPVVDFGIESLSLLGLAGDLAAWLDRDISPTLLWEYPTIAELAAHLAATPPPLTERRALVPLQTRGAGPPFHLIHEVSGTLIPYQHLLARLGDGRLIYGFEVPFGEDEADQIESVEALAARYVAELRAHQPSGPYFLGSYSMGGLLAFEMACQLRAAGESIGLLVLMDTMFPRLTRHPVSPWGQLRAHTRVFLDLPRDQRRAHLQRRVERVVARLRKRPLPPVEIDPQQDKFMRSPIRARLAETMRLYHPRVFDGSLVYLCAAKRDWTVSDDVAAWRRVVSGRVHTRRVPGRHNDIARDPNAIHLAAQLHHSLRRAQL